MVVKADVQSLSLSDLALLKKTYKLIEKRVGNGDGIVGH